MSSTVIPFPHHALESGEGESTRKEDVLEFWDECHANVREQIEAGEVDTVFAVVQIKKTAPGEDYSESGVETWGTFSDRILFLGHLMHLMTRMK